MLYLSFLFHEDKTRLVIVIVKVITEKKINEKNLCIFRLLSVGVS